MAAAGLPLLKLSTLLVKTIAKPLGRYMKNESKYYPRLDRTFCGLANAIHYANVRVNVLASGYKFVSLRPLPHDRALAEGVAIFSEGLVLGFSGLVIVVEFKRSALKSAASAAKAAAKEAAHEAEQDRQRSELEKRLALLEQAVGKRALEREEEKAAKAAAQTKRKGVWSLFG